jgi:hypothetical protein
MRVKKDREDGTVIVRPATRADATRRRLGAIEAASGDLSTSQA